MCVTPATPRCTVGLSLPTCTFFFPATPNLGQIRLEKALPVRLLTGGLLPAQPRREGAVTRLQLGVFALLLGHLSPEGPKGLGRGLARWGKKG